MGGKRRTIYAEKQFLAEGAENAELGNAEFLGVKIPADSSKNTFFREQRLLINKDPMLIKYPMLTDKHGILSNKRPQFFKNGFYTTENSFFGG